MLYLEFAAGAGVSGNAADDSELLAESSISFNLQLAQHSSSFRLHTVCQVEIFQKHPSILVRRFAKERACDYEQRRENPCELW